MNAGFSRHWEKEFNKDMTELHVRPPTALARVSDYVQEIVTFIEVGVSGAVCHAAVLPCAVLPCDMLPCCQ